MSLLKKSGYQSEFTQFINQLKLKDPKIEEGQRAGRARLWDLPPTDLDTQERLKASRVSQKAYVYQNK
jgi:Protein of unknown function (DUF3460)